MNRRLLVGGITGSVVAAVCCFTPVLVLLFGALGLSAWLGWADYVLVPALIFFLLLTGYAISRRPGNAHAACDVACKLGSKDASARLDSCCRDAQPSVPLGAAANHSI